MIEQFTEWIRPILEFSLVRRTRRNHALEHATINVLTERLKRFRMAGRSTDGGFVLFGDVPTEDIKSAVIEALTRMSRGERGLALHPNCGTNLVTAGVLTTFAGWIGLRSSNKPLTLDRLSWTMILMMMSLLVSQPLGMKLQQHITTEGDPGDLEVVSVSKRQTRFPFSNQPVTVHQVVTRGG